MENPSPADSSLAIISLLCLIIYNMCMNELSISYFLYGLHAATTLRSLSIFLPRIVPITHDLFNKIDILRCIGFIKK